MSGGNSSNNGNRNDRSDGEDWDSKFLEVANVAAAAAVVAGGLYYLLKSSSSNNSEPEAPFQARARCLSKEPDDVDDPCFLQHHDNNPSSQIGWNKLESGWLRRRRKALFRKEEEEEDEEEEEADDVDDSWFLQHYDNIEEEADDVDDPWSLEEEEEEEEADDVDDSWSLQHHDNIEEEADDVDDPWSLEEEEEEEAADDVDDPWSREEEEEEADDVDDPWSLEEEEEEEAADDVDDPWSLEEEEEEADDVDDPWSLEEEEEEADDVDDPWSLEEEEEEEADDVDDPFSLEEQEEEEEADDVDDPWSLQHHDNIPSSQTGWTNPKSGWVKLNVDGSKVHKGRPSAGCGGVLRDESGEWLQGFAQKLDPSCKVHVTELLAILKGMELASDMNVEKLVVESDNKSAVSWVENGCKSNHPQFDLISRIRQLRFDPKWQVEVFHIPREANGVADRLARNARDLPTDGLRKYPYPPRNCSRLVLEDAQGVSYY